MGMRLRWGSIHKKLSAMAHSVEFFSMCVCVLVGGEWRNLPLVVRVQPPTALPLNDLTQHTPNNPTTHSSAHFICPVCRCLSYFRFTLEFPFLAVSLAFWFFLESFAALWFSPLLSHGFSLAQQLIFHGACVRDFLFPRNALFLYFLRLLFS